jgi:hypothetical protein
MLLSASRVSIVRQYQRAALRVRVPTVSQAISAIKPTYRQRAKDTDMEATKNLFSALTRLRSLCMKCQCAAFRHLHVSWRV